MRGAAVATAAAVGLQILLTRLFSVVLWYHLGYFVVSLAMLGFALGGVIVRRAVADGRPLPRGLEPAGLGAAASAATVLAAAVVVRLPLKPLELLGGVVQPLALLSAGVLLAAPFTLLGAAVCGCLHRGGGARIGRVYGATFVGGALGALLCLGLMELLGAPRALAGLAALPLLAGLPRRRDVLAGALILVAALAAVPDRILPLRSRKHFPNVPAERVLHEEWNAFSRVTFYENPERHGLWGIPPHFTGPLPESIGVAIDSWAITSILDLPPGPDAHAFLERYPPTLAYVGAPSGFDALVIGAGGGVDVLAALDAGAGHVTAVEINPLIVEAVKGRYREHAGDLYRDPRVEAVVAEGRRFVEDDDATYDRVVLSGVDTFAATEAGAFALSENYLYTLEALRAYYDRLEPGGVLALTRWWFDPPRQTLRLTLTATRMLAGLGVEDASSRVMVFRTHLHSLFLLKKGEFDADERDALQRGAALRGLETVHPRPDGAYPLYAEAMRADRVGAIAARHPYRVDPTTDDAPFFFENTRLSRVFRTEGDWIHDRLGGQELLVVTACVLFLLALPLLWLGGLRGRAPLGVRVRTSAPFLLVGLAYLLVEIPLLPRLSLLLGHPAAAVAVVLVALLLGSGVGSWWAGRIDPARAGLSGFAAAAAVLAIPVAAYPWVLEALSDVGTVGRSVAVVAFLAVPAVAMGMPFPLAVRRLEPLRPALVPAAFVVNGVASALAGPLAVMISMELGFRATLVCGAACYAAAGVALGGRGGGRPG